MRVVSDERGEVNEEVIPFGGNGVAGLSDADLTPQDKGSDGPLPGIEVLDVAKLLDLMEAERQALLADPRVADAKVKFLGVADDGSRSGMFGVLVWLHQPRACFYGEGTSLADASMDALLTASVEHERAKRAAKAVAHV